MLAVFCAQNDDFLSTTTLTKTEINEYDDRENLRK